MTSWAGMRIRQSCERGGARRGFLSAKVAQVSFSVSERWAVSEFCKAGVWRMCVCVCVWVRSDVCVPGMVLAGVSVCVTATRCMTVLAQRGTQKLKQCDSSAGASMCQCVKSSHELEL